MGRNRAIKMFDPRRTGESLDLFTATDSRLPVIVELLRSPWITKGSEVGASASIHAVTVSGHAGKHRQREIEVDWDGAKAAPRSFTFDGRHYPVDAVVQTWIVERAWWDLRAHASRRCFRVLSRGGLYDLAYDRIAERWLLTGVVD